MSLASYTLPLTAASGIWSYSPERDAAASTGWNVSYTGSSTWPSGGATTPGEGNLYLRTQYSGASIAADFVGTGLLLCVKDNGASFSVRLDGQDPTADVPNDQACIAQGASKTISFADQDFKSHRVEVNISNASSTQEFQFYGAVIETRITLLGAEDTVQEKLIDDRDPGWDMTRRAGSAWDVTSDTRLDQATGSFTCIWGHGGASEAAYTFSNASAVVLSGIPSSGTFFYSVILEGDGKTLDSSDNSIWTVPKTALFFHAGLDYSKIYTLRFRNWSDTHPDCTTGPDGKFRYCCQAFDSLTIIGSTMQFSGVNPQNTKTLPPTSSSPSGPAPSNANSSSTNTGVIAGAVVGGFFGTLLLFSALFFLWRRRKRQSHTPQYVPSPYPSPGIDPSTPNIHHPMFQLATFPPSPNAQSGFISHDPASPSEATRRYFPTASHPRTSTFSDSVASPVTADPFATPWIVDATGSPVLVDLDRGSSPSQVTSSGRSAGSPSESSPMITPSRSSKASRMAGEVARGRETATETPPPYRG